MGCIFLLIALISPRLAFLILWIATNLVDRAFDSVLVPLLGIVFFPITTLVYVLVYAPVTEVSGLGWVLVGIAFLLDISSYGGAARYRRAA
jgi:hypothetical protein